MRTFRAGRQGTRRGARRPMDWEYALIQLGGLGTASVQAVQVVTSTELNAEYTDPTLMASRLVCGIRNQTAAGANGVVACGLIAWDDINNTPPASADAPGPIRNGNLDWLIRQVFPFQNAPIATALNSLAGDGSVLSKARRRLGSSRTVLFCVENQSGAPIDVVADCRVLIKE